jgi:hypothetical protein
MNCIAKSEVSSSPEEQWFHKLASHYVEAQIYFHLNQCGVFQRLSCGAASAGTIAASLDLSEQVLGVLLDYVSSTGDIIAKAPGGAYDLTPFGASVLKRYGRLIGGEQYKHNIFDVRIGSWGPVWENLGGMLTKKMAYGKDVRRNGDFASEGVYIIAAPLAPAVEQAVQAIGAKAVAEIGPTSGVLAQIAKRHPEIRCIGADIKPKSLEEGRQRAEAEGVTSILWLERDLFRVHEWIDDLPCDGPVLFFSFHTHEFLARGTDKVTAALRTITAWPKTGAVLAVEQPRLTDEERESAGPVKWGYSQSHVLIHHLIENGQILTSDEWSGLLLAGGCTRVETSASPCFGFKAFMGHTARN